VTKVLVKGSGPLDSDLWFVGMAPSREEIKAGHPFANPRGAGGLLDLVLRQVGLLRAEVRLENLFEERPPRDDTGFFYIDTKKQYLNDLGAQHVERLRRLLEEHRPNVVVALGAEAMWVLAGKRRITKWRGSLLPCVLAPGLKVYCTYHPEYVRKHLQEKGQRKSEKKAMNLLPISIRDFQRVKEQSLTPMFPTPNRNITLPQTLTEVIRFISEIPSGSTCTVDIETRPPGPLITRLGLCWDPLAVSAISIPFIWEGRPYWTAGEFGRILFALSELFLRDDVQKNFQGGMYDLPILGKFWGLRCAQGTVDDTMVCHHATYPHLPKGLDFIASSYTWEPYYKDDGKLWGKRIGDHALSIYNGKDVCVPREAWPIISQDCRQLGMWEGYKRSMSYYPSLLAMTIRGVKCDMEKREELRVLFSRGAEECSVEIEKLMGRSYQVSTAYTKDLVQLLYVDMGLTPQYKGGKLTTEDAALLRLKRLHPTNPVIELIRRRRKFLKLLSTNVEMEVSKDGRFHTTYNPAGTTTWRLSSSESPFGGGGNLQNIPVRGEEGAEIRKLFIADPGKVLISADFSQAEAREVAWLANEKAEIEAFLRGDDIHGISAVDLGLVPPDTDPNDVRKLFGKEVRQPAKHMKYGYNYEIGPRQLQSRLLKEGFDFEYSECVNVLAKIRMKRPMIEGWKRQVKAKIDTDRTLVTPLGRKRIFYGRRGPDLYRKAIAFVPQSTVGELLCISIREIHSILECQERICEILLNIHDEVVVQADPSDVQRLIPMMRELMTISHQVNGRELTIPVDFKVGENWGEMEGM